MDLVLELRIYNYARTWKRKELSLLNSEFGRQQNA